MNPKRDSYAILSHTWGLEEVPFQKDLTSAKWMQGFAKIERTCQLAKERNLQYAWVDTCCIDKSSSAELSEAINSMFRWYQEAAVCFAFLIDASLELIKPEVSSYGGCGAVMLEHLRGCRYFERGWTLQELLAPKHVDFYDGDWKWMGSKDSEFLGPLSDVTGIDSIYLMEADSIWSATVGTRMRWASRRVTTRLEDTAYCLLGIFDINMPLIYGEGEKAFIRLQEEICKQSNDMCLFAWTEQPDNPLSYSSFRKYRGIFACHPCEFTDFKEPSQQYFGYNFSGEFAVTNKGIRFDDIYLSALGNKTVLWLDYNTFHHPKRGIFLQRTPDGYRRSNSDKLAKLPVIALPQTKQRIYIQRDIPRQWENPQYADAFMFTFVRESGLRLVNAIPNKSFNFREQAFLTRGECFLGVLHLYVDESRICVICCLGRPFSADAPSDQPLEARYRVISAHSVESREISEKAFTGRREDIEEVYKSLVAKNCLGPKGKDVFCNSYLWGSALIIESDRDMQNHLRITSKKRTLNPWLNMVTFRARL